MSAKHTPGPWVFERDRWGDLNIKSANARDLRVAPCIIYPARNIGGLVAGENCDDYSEALANARLIAAAPDLLTELKGLVDLLDVMGLLDDEVLDPARAAIAKATGGEA